MTEPTTEAGRALLGNYTEWQRLNFRDPRTEDIDDLRDAIRRIEAEARATADAEIRASLGWALAQIERFAFNQVPSLDSTWHRVYSDARALLADTEAERNG